MPSRRRVVALDSSTPASAEPSAHTAIRVATQMREQITRGVLRPGARLKDTALAEAYQVSRNTVRDSLRQLESDGLVVLRNNAGYAVRTLTEEDAHDIYRVRRLLESAGVDASTQVPSSALAPLTTIVEASRVAAVGQRWSEVGTSALLLHQALVSLIGSPRTDSFFANILAQLRLVFAVMDDEASFQGQWFDRDEELAQLLLTGQRRRAQQELTQYLNDSETQIIDAIRSSGAPL